MLLARALLTGRQAAVRDLCTEGTCRPVNNPPRPQEGNEGRLQGGGRLCSFSQEKWPWERVVVVVRATLASPGLRAALCGGGGEGRAGG